MKKILSAVFIAFTVLTWSFAEVPQKNASTVDYSVYDKDFSQNLLLSEENYLKEMQTTVESYLSERVKTIQLETRNLSEIMVYSYSADEPEGTVVIFHGYTEFAEKYREVVYYFLKSGYNTITFDHRSHGYSTRDIPDSNGKVHISDYDIFVTDAKDVVDTIARKMTEDKPLYLFAHSMGGAIGASYLETYPEDFSKAILTSPMMEINTGKYPDFFAWILSNIMVKFNKGTDYILGGRDFDGIFTFTENQADSYNRKYHSFLLRLNNVHYQTSAGTYQWLKESFSFQKKIIKPENTKKIQTPLILFQAEKDDTVRPGGQNKFIQNISKTSQNAKLLVFPDVHHTIWESKSRYLASYYSIILDFFQE